MTQQEQNLREQIKPIITELVRITKMPSAKLWGIVRRGGIVKKYDADFCVKVLSGLPEGYCFQKCIGIIKHEFTKANGFKNNVFIDQLSEAWKQ